MYFFNIKKNPANIKLEGKQEPDFSKYKKISSNIHGQERMCENILYFLPDALKSLDKHIGWGKKNPDNQVEQGGILIGEVFYDEHRRKVIGIVQDIIAGESAPSDNMSLNMTTEVWNSMYRELDLKNRNSQKEMRIIGWYHTHPNNLDVYMSTVDIRTQKCFFRHEWQFAVVFNPHRKIWKVFSGERCMRCQGYFLLDFELFESNFETDNNDGTSAREYPKPYCALGNMIERNHTIGLPNHISSGSGGENQFIMAENKRDERKTFIRRAQIQRIMKSVHYEEYGHEDNFIDIGLIYQLIMRKKQDNENILDMVNYTPLAIIFGNQNDNTPVVITDISHYKAVNNCVQMIVIFSAELETDIRLLRKKYERCHFLLWINLNNSSDIHFYDLL